MEKEDGSVFYLDDGTEVDSERSDKPALCRSCRMAGDPDEEILCDLTRSTQQGEEDFLCGTYRPQA